MTETEFVLDDSFRGDDSQLLCSIRALLALDAEGALRPHGIGGHARALLSSAGARLAASPQPPHTEAPAAQDEREALRLLEKFVEVAEEEWSHYHHTADGRKWLIETRAFLAARAPQAAVEGQAHQTDALEKALAECRDAFPVPEPGHPLEGDWTSAMSDPLSVPEYVRACVAAPQATVQAEAALWRKAVQEAYGWLWHVNNEPMAPAPLWSPEKAAYEARKNLRELLTMDERGEAINAVRGMLGNMAAANSTQAEAVSEKQQKLRDLADRIDHEKLWAWAGMDHHKMTPAQRDRMDAGVALRRYANLLQPNRWLIFPPTGPVQFSAGTLDAAVAMAKRDEARRAAAQPSGESKQ